MRRWLLPAVLLSALGVIHAQIWWGRGSVSQVAQLRQQLADQQQRNAQAQDTNARLTAELRDLQDGLEGVEEKARHDLGMLKPDEVFVQFAR